MRKGFDYIKQEYWDSILKSGGIPVLLPNTTGNAELEYYLDSIDGLMVTGGADIHPSYFDQKPHPKLSNTTLARDKFEVMAIKSAIKRDIPLLGICRGHQVLNVALGGNLYQDLSCIDGRTLKHADPNQTGKVFHDIWIDKESMLFGIMGSEVLETNSSHHQVVDKIGRGLRPVAFSSDGVIEAIEMAGKKFILGVQWHPEAIFSRKHSQKLFKKFVEISS